MDIYGQQDQEVYYTVYRTTNLVNGKAYIGVHKTTDPWDDYLGSGKILRQAITKHGRKQFIKEVLAVLDNGPDAYDVENRMVNEAWLAAPESYNVKLGGHGGFDHIDRAKLKEDLKRHYTGRARPQWVKDKIAETKRRKPTVWTEEMRAAHTNRMRNLSPETKRKMSMAAKTRGRNPPRSRSINTA